MGKAAGLRVPASRGGRRRLQVWGQWWGQGELPGVSPELGLDWDLAWRPLAGPSLTLQGLWASPGVRGGWAGSGTLEPGNWAELGLSSCALQGLVTSLGLGVPRACLRWLERVQTLTPDPGPVLPPRSQCSVRPWSGRLARRRGLASGHSPGKWKVLKPEHCQGEGAGVDGRTPGPASGPPALPRPGFPSVWA